MNILITGSGGFIGKHLSLKLKRAGHKVYGFDKINGQDLLKIKSIRSHISKNKIGLAYHLAAEADLNKARKNPYNCINLNIVSTINIAQVCWEYKIPLIYISTDCVYGNQKTFPSDEDNTKENPAEIYALTKLSGEMAVKAFGDVGLQWKIARIPTTYGEGMRQALAVYVFLDQALKGKPMTIHGTGKQTRELAYIEDTVAGLVSLLKAPENQIYNISSGEEISVLEMVKLIKDLTKTKSKVVFVKDRKGQVFKEIVSIVKIRSATGWEPKTRFAQGLLKSLIWMQRKR
ncbi:MAG: NAD-dependent epimerase/dehydratase family protein [Candidatus Margulisiibacteriota bacterium]